jgi:predicted DCC family thiol-disulfide oxidoreductase YuxK
MVPNILVYDSDCGPCTNFRNIIGFLDPKRTLSFASFAEAEELGLLQGMPRELRYKSFHIITPGKPPRSGADALPLLFGLITRWSGIERTILLFPFGFQTVSSVYGVLSRLHDKGSCASPTNERHRKQRRLRFGITPKTQLMKGLGFQLKWPKSLSSRG